MLQSEKMDKHGNKQKPKPPKKVKNVTFLYFLETFDISSTDDFVANIPLPSCHALLEGSKKRRPWIPGTRSRSLR